MLIQALSVTAEKWNAYTELAHTEREKKLIAADSTAVSISRVKDRPEIGLVSPMNKLKDILKQEDQQNLSNFFIDELNPTS